MQPKVKYDHLFLGKHQSQANASKIENSHHPMNMSANSVLLSMRDIIPFLNQDGKEKVSEQRRDSTKKYGEEPHSAAAEVNA